VVAIATVSSRVLIANILDLQLNVANSNVSILATCVLRLPHRFHQTSRNLIHTPEIPPSYPGPEIGSPD
jgi:hypothetical protein